MMCEICLQNPCHPRCPNADSITPFAICWICGFEIYEGDEYFMYDNKKVCSECVKEFTNIAGEE